MWKSSRTPDRALSNFRSHDAPFERKKLQRCKFVFNRYSRTVWTQPCESNCLKASLRIANIFFVQEQQFPLVALSLSAVWEALAGDGVRNGPLFGTIGEDLYPLIWKWQSQQSDNLTLLTATGPQATLVGVFHTSRVDDVETCSGENWGEKQGDLWTDRHGLLILNVIGCRLSKQWANHHQLLDRSVKTCSEASF